MARPSLLADKKRRARLIRVFTEALEKCLPQSTACELAGISEATFYGWMSAGESGRKPYSEFFEAVMRARARGEEQMVDAVQIAAFSQVDEDGQPLKDPNWKAAAWLLERRYPDKYGASVTVRRAEEKALGVILDRLREGLDPQTWARCLAVLAEEPGEAEARGDELH